MFSDLFDVVAKGDLHPVLLPQHLAGHQGVEDGRAGQRQAEICAEQPPVLCWFIKLHKKEEQRGRVGLRSNICVGALWAGDKACKKLIYWSVAAAWTFAGGEGEIHGWVWRCAGHPFTKRWFISGNTRRSCCYILVRGTSCKGKTSNLSSGVWIISSSMNSFQPPSSRRHAVTLSAPLC